MSVLSGITKEEDVLNCKDEIAPLFYTDSVADLKDIFVFAEDMTNEDEEKQALAELERENILERQREGIEIAKSEGKYKGRKPIDYNEAQMKALCKKWRAGEITATAAMKELGLKPNTFYRRVKEMGL